MNKTVPIRTKNDIDGMRRLCASYDPKYELMFDFGVYCGLRISDILRIQVKDIKYPEFIVREKKTGNEFTVKMPLCLVKRLKAHIRRCMLRQGDYIIYSSKGGKSRPLSRQQAYNVLRRAADEMGLKNIGTHSLRKSFAYDFYEKTGSVVQLQKAFGHKYVSTTMIHYLPDFFPVR